MPRLVSIALCAVFLTTAVLASDPSARSAASVPNVPVSPVPKSLSEASSLVADASSLAHQPVADILSTGPADLSRPESRYGFHCFWSSQF
jgi:hypothetical protein